MFKVILIMLIITCILMIFVTDTESLEYSEKECQLSGITERILNCELNGNSIPTELLTSGTLPEFATCWTRSLAGITHLSCDGTSWKIVSGVEEWKVRHKRHFRSPFYDHFCFRPERAFKHSVEKLATSSGRDHCQRNKWKWNYERSGLVCEVHVPIKADPLRIYAQASWNEPQPKDFNAIIRVNRNGRRPLSYFPEKRTTVTYIAKTIFGNIFRYEFHIDVTIVRCPKIYKIENGYFQCSPVTEFINGATCIFGCYLGFWLHGTKYMTCQPDGKWSPTKLPTCKPLTCPDSPNVIGAGSPSCTNGTNFRSICSYQCSTSGYDMPEGVSSSLVCTNTRAWRKHGEPRCVDIESPKFTFCPSVVVAGTESGLETAKVEWKTPKVTDNSGSARVVIKTDKPSGSRFKKGIYNIRYSAVDGAENSVDHKSECFFNVVVKDILCHKLYPTPWVHFHCPHGYRIGSSCNVTCDPGKKLVGDDRVRCERKNQTVLFGSWNWKSGTQTTCNSTHKCVPLVPPVNGAVVCDNWEGGKFCQVQCKKGTEMSSYSLNTLYVCKATDIWSEHPPDIKTCRVVQRHRKRHLLDVEIDYYYNGECTNATTKEEIANNFIRALKSNVYNKGICSNNTDCSSRNVQIFCGASTRRRRSENNTTVVNMTLKLILRLPISTPADDSVDAIEEQYIQLLNNIETFAREKESDIFNEVKVSQQMFKSNGLQTECDVGSVKSEESLNCVDCPEGTFYKKTSDGAKCRACAKGSYQNEEAQTLCKPCPERTTTLSVGSTSLDDCQEACAPGTISVDGLLPCSPCELGYYQTMYGQDKCVPCPFSMTTYTYGAPSVSKCENFDISFVPEETSYVNLTVQESIHLNDFTLAFWIQLENINDENLYNANGEPPKINFTEETDKNETATVSVKFFDNNGEEILRMTFERSNMSFNTTSDNKVPVLDDGWHRVILRRNSCSFVVSIDGISINIGSYKPDCKMLRTKTISMVAENGTKGSISQLNIWHGNQVFGEERKCFSREFGNAVSWKKYEDAVLFNAYIITPSLCDDFDNCADSPCLNGICRDILNGFECYCNKGFKGVQCEENIDDCVASVCLNNATCVDGIANYSCLCPVHFTGSFCEIEMVDGKWSEWDSWSECSTTCGEGSRKRKRLCNSPSPDNGGENCTGNEYGFSNCDNSNCTVCPSLEPPENGYMECENKTESINCTISCDDGYDFDIEPLQFYYCGTSTFNEWNFQTDENTERRFPKCVEINMPENLKLIYMAQYRDLYCENTEEITNIKGKIDSVVQTFIQSTNCVHRESCKIIYIGVTNCDDKTQRKRSESKAGFGLHLVSHQTRENNSVFISDLEEAFNTIEQAAKEGKFTVALENDIFELDLNSTNINGEVECKSGEIRVNYYCVSCGKGAYLEADRCSPCPIGTYQDKTGQLECDPCPPNKLTIGIRSTSIEECNVQVERKDDDNIEVVWTIVGIVIALALILVGLGLIYKRYRSRHGNFLLSKSETIEMHDPKLKHKADKKKEGFPTLLQKKAIHSSLDDYHEKKKATEDEKEEDEESPMIEAQKEDS